MNKFLNLLGMARRAGKISMGHDMAVDSVIKKKSFAVFIAGNCSQRLVNEFCRAADTAGNQSSITVTPYSIDVFHKALGYKAGVVSIDDEGFAHRLTQLLNSEKEDNNL